MSAQYWNYRGSKGLLNGATVVFTVAIAVLGAVMMTLTSSPLVKGAAFLWLPAALQLIAGTWLGPLRGGIAAGVGAQLAGIIAYGGWAPADWIMNLIAGGVANAALPALLFQAFRLPPDLGAKPPKSGVAVGIAIILVLALIVVGVAFAQLYLFGSQDIPLMTAAGYIAPIVLLLLAPVALSSIRLEGREFLLGILVSVVACFVSASIGVVGAWVGGQTWEGAVFGTGIGWFLGDTASCILGLYVMARFGAIARERGLAPLWPPKVAHSAPHPLPA
jgi:hypothetical protein